MKSIASELDSIVERSMPGLHDIGEEEFSHKPSPQKWSKKEMLGHLIDSAQNNTRRFIVAQYEDRPKIVYKQDEWVSLSHYQEYELLDLINFWYFANKHICHILKFIPQDAAGRESQTEDLHPINWLAKDYVKHLLHHLHEILNIEPVAYP